MIRVLLLLLDGMRIHTVHCATKTNPGSAAGCACLGGLSGEDWRRTRTEDCCEKIKLSKIISPIQIFYVILQSDCKIT